MGKTTLGRSGRSGRIFASVEGRQALQSALVAQVAQAYFELIALDQELAIVRQTLAARQEGVRLAKLRFEGGLTSENPLRQAQVDWPEPKPWYRD